MTDHVNKWLREHAQYDRYIVTRPHIKCKSGHVLSVQASTAHQCFPKNNHAERYTHVEVHMPREVKVTEYPLMRDWYAFGSDPEHKRPQWFVSVPVELVNRFIEDHGGIYGKA